MKIRFSTARKLGVGFGVVALLIVIVISITVYSVQNGVQTLKKSNDVNDAIANVYDPSEYQLKKLNNLVSESKLLITMWAWVETKPDEDFKLRLHKIMNIKVPQIQDSLNTLSKNWKLKKKTEELDKINKKINRLFKKYEVVINLHPDLESYNDKQAYFLGINYVSDGFDIDLISDETIGLISNLEDRFSNLASKARNDMNTSFQKTMYSFDLLMNLILILGAALVLGAIIIGVLTTRSIVSPVNELRNMLVSLKKGVLPNSKMKISNDEIGDMSAAMNQLVEGLRRTTKFANELGQSNFTYDYRPLSKEDTLGHALLKMRKSLAENERLLEHKVEERTQEVVQQKNKIEKQRERVEELYKNVTDSIRYAKRLQETILPPENKIAEIIEDYFVLFRPKDIVSGDFYWVEEHNNRKFFTAVDCTGHGVPGAFMSLVGANGLNQAVFEHGKESPAEIMNDLNEFAMSALNKNLGNNNVRDGMDMTLCILDQKKNKLVYASANNPLYIVRDGEIFQHKADKFSIGSFSINDKSFTNYEVDVRKGDVIYIFSDGYPDQFGGPKGKKFMYKQFRAALIENAHLPMQEQQLALNNTLDTWMNGNEQVDDILIFGVRV